MIKQTLKNIARIAIAPIIAGGLIACTDTSDYFVKKGSINKHEVYVWKDNTGRHLAIYDANSSVDSPHLYALDNALDEDNRFDEIKLKRIPKGDSIEQYANLQSLEEIYKQICEQEEE